MSLLGPMVARSFIASTGPSRRGLAGVVSSVLWWAPEVRAEAPPGERLCSGAVSHLAGEDGDVFLVGVAHLSNQSKELVRVAIRSLRPDLVMVELDASRVKNYYTTPGDPEDRRWIWVPPGAEEERKESTGAVPSQGATLSGWQQVLVKGLRRTLQTYYKVQEQRLGVSQGSQGKELAVACEEGVKVGAPVLLGDRSMDITYSRVLEEIGKGNLKKVEEAREGPESQRRDLQEDLASALPGNPAEQDGIQGLRAAMDSTTEQPNARRLRRRLQESFPGFFTAFVDERDAFMTSNLLKGLSAGKRRIVAVVGGVHVQGIEERLVKAAKLQVVNTCFT